MSWASAARFGYVRGVPRPLFVVCLLLAGCPKQREPAQRSPAAQSCSTDADCNGDGGVTCGLLRQCVDRLCESAPSRPVPCR